MEIRKAAIADIPMMICLLEELFSIEQDFNADSSKQRRGLELLLSNKDAACAMVAINAEGEVCGMATIQLVASTAEGAMSGWIEDVVVAKASRRKGVAKTLLASLIEWGHEKGATRFQLLADKDNTPALELYGSLGWTSLSMLCLRHK